MYFNNIHTKLCWISKQKSVSWFSSIPKATGMVYLNSTFVEKYSSSSPFVRTLILLRELFSDRTAFARTRSGVHRSFSYFRWRGNICSFSGSSTIANLKSCLKQKSEKSNQKVEQIFKKILCKGSGFECLTGKVAFINFSSTVNLILHSPSDEEQHVDRKRVGYFIHVTDVKNECLQCDL